MQYRTPIESKFSWQQPIKGFSGYLSEIRITKGIARWTKAFAVPNRRY